MAEIKVVDVSEENVEDLIFVCSHRFLSDPRYATGIELKKRWVRKTLKEVWGLRQDSLLRRQVCGADDVLARDLKPCRSKS